MRVSFDTESVEVEIETMFSQSIYMDPSMMKNLRPSNARVVSLLVKRIRCNHQGGWIIPLVYYNVLLVVVLIPDTILFTDSDLAFL